MFSMQFGAYLRFYVSLKRIQVPRKTDGKVTRRLPVEGSSEPSMMKITWELRLDLKTDAQ